MKVDLLTFDGVVSVDQFLDWIYEAERFFNIMNVKQQ